MDNLAKFTFGIFNTWYCLACVCGWSSLNGNLVPASFGRRWFYSWWFRSVSDKFVRTCKQGAEEYAALGCVSCHTQQVRGLRRVSMLSVVGASVPLFPEIMFYGCTIRIPESVLIWQMLAYVGIREWFHMLWTSSIFPDSLCPPTPFLYKVRADHCRYWNCLNRWFWGHRVVRPTVRSNRLVAYLMSLKQDYVTKFPSSNQMIIWRDDFAWSFS